MRVADLFRGRTGNARGVPRIAALLSALLLVGIGIGVGALIWAGSSASSTPVPRVAAVNGVPTASTTPDVTAQVQNAKTRVLALQSAFNTSRLSCVQSATLDQQLAYVGDALNQGNVLGARTLLQVSMDEASKQAHEGLLSPSTAAQLQSKGSAILASIPTRGKVKNEFHPASPGPSLAAHHCVGEADGAAKVSEFLRALISHAIAHVPYAGAFLAALVEVLWPGSESHSVTWDELTSYVDQRVNEAIDQHTKETLDAKLKGLSTVLHDYVVALQDKTNTAQIKDEYLTSLALLKSDAPEFQPQTRGYLVLPEYTQLQNLLLVQLRDGIMNGASFGLGPNLIGDYKKQIATYIADGGKWVADQMKEYHNHVSFKYDNHSNVNRFNANAELDDALVPVVADQQYYWQYLDPVKYAPPYTPPPNKRILYTRVYGTIDHDGSPTVQGDGKPPLVHITVWAYDRIDAMQLTYGNGSQPDPKMGGNGGTTDPPKGGSFQVGPLADSRGWVTRVYGWAGDVPEGLGFVFTKGDSTVDSGRMGGGTATAAFYDLSFPNEVLAYIKINGVSNYYNSADSIVYGFRYADSYP